MVCVVYIVLCLHSFALTTREADFSEKLVTIYQTTLRQVPDDSYAVRTSHATGPLKGTGLGLTARSRTFSSSYTSGSFAS